MKIDGHTHTQYCPHGSREYVELMIERAIELGFDEYHITEHSPVPNSFSNRLMPIEAVESLAMAENEVDSYINYMLKVKEGFKDRIQIKIGFELDFLQEHTEWTKQFLNDYGQYCDTGILSVHYLIGKEGWHCIDYKAEDTKDGLVDYYGSHENFQLAYYELVKQSVLVDLGPYKPKRIGHMTLCNKYKHFLNSQETDQVFEKQLELLKCIKLQNYTLDYNTAGLFKPYCFETYPPEYLINLAKSLNIPFTYGSDSHSIKDIGRGYDEFFQKVKLSSSKI